MERDLPTIEPELFLYHDVLVLPVKTFEASLFYQLSIGGNMKLRFDMIGLFVSDLKQMAGFYRDVIGLDIDWDGQGPYAEFRHEGIRFAMFERALLPELLGLQPSYPSGINGTFELAINVGAPENVDTTFRKLVESGATPIYAPRNEPWKMRSSMIADPEGNLIEIGSDFWS